MNNAKIKDIILSIACLIESIKTDEISKDGIVEELEKYINFLKMEILNEK